MRIISGIYKSRILKSPETYKVRPTSDRAKESLFNILSHQFGFEGSICMDLFCGSGNLGLESISRGAEKCYFVDKDTKLISRNIDLLNAHGKSEVIRSDVLMYLEKNMAEGIDIVFCDPPFDFESYDRLLDYLFRLKCLIILEHAAGFKIKPDFEKYIVLNKKIGTIHFTFFDFKING